jgi:hypothetical protein
VVAQQFENSLCPITVAIDEQWNGSQQGPHADVGVAARRDSTIEAIEERSHVDELGPMLHEIEIDHLGAGERACGSGHGTTSKRGMDDRPIMVREDILCQPPGSSPRPPPWRVNECGHCLDQREAMHPVLPSGAKLKTLSTGAEPPTGTEDHAVWPAKDRPLGKVLDADMPRPRGIELGEGQDQPAVTARRRGRCLE